MKVLAVGATGRFAGLVVPALADRGVQVRALVHDPGKAGKAVRASIDVGVRKFVYSGVYHPSLSLVNHASTRPIEEALYTSELAFTALQPAMFLQGLDDALRNAVRTGQLVMPWSKSSKLTYVDYRDVAEVVAIAMTSNQLDYGTFELAAGGMLDRVQLAAVMSAESGRDIAATDPDATAWPKSLPPGLAAMFDTYDRHGFHGGNDLVLHTILGRRPTSVSDYIHELAANTQKGL